LNTGLDFHGLSGLPIYRCWQAMHRRCSSPSDFHYGRYGGRGIQVCRRWNSVHAFLEDMGHPPAGMSLGRIDNDGHYEPGNCRWETQEQQNENTCRNRFVGWQGRQQTIKAWAQELDLNPRQISERLRRGWTVERALTTPTPQGFEESRRQHLQRSKALWAKNGRRYRGLPPAQPRQPRPSKTPEQRSQLVQRVKALRRQGQSLRAIASQLGISKSLVGLYAA
jgi:hypothetical protein